MITPPTINQQSKWFYSLKNDKFEWKNYYSFRWWRDRMFLLYYPSFFLFLSLSLSLSLSFYIFIREPKTIQHPLPIIVQCRYRIFIAKIFIIISNERSTIDNLIRINEGKKTMNGTDCLWTELHTRPVKINVPTVEVYRWKKNRI